MVSLRGVPTADGFIKRYEIQYQPKKMGVDGAEVLAQYGCINFHLKRYVGHGAKLTLTVKNKWSTGWTRAWFYCKVPLLRSPISIMGKSVYTLHSSMAPLDFSTEPSFECGDDDSGDLVFIHTTSLIGGWDTVEEYLACRIFPLLASFNFTEIADEKTLILKVIVPMPEFPLAKLQGEGNDHFLVRVELGAENVVGSYGRAEHDACIQALPNGGWLNRVFEKAGWTEFLRRLVWPMVPV
jgi:hypothetical protein